MMNTQIQKEISEYPDDQTLDFIQTMVGERWVVSPELFAVIQKRLGVTRISMMLLLAHFVKRRAVTDISNFQVGACGYGKSGNYYLGVNYEVVSFPLNRSIHGEQFLVSNVLHHEDSLLEVAVNAVPCGHCRQFFMETEMGENLMIYTPLFRKRLGDILISPFGPKDLEDIPFLLFENGTTPLEICGDIEDTELAVEALSAAMKSYAHYSKCYSGVSVRTVDNKIYSGMYIESAAFNPSLSPLSMILAVLKINNVSYEQVTDIALVEKSNPQVGMISTIKEFADIYLQNAKQHFYTCQ
eukprot:TRINITY_DN2896_c0_g1_i2.p1 TRINITY_DN2896_c0_g1~~TRINITY_DN2896_c0_g1_i2.p1  ORF type:complete len:324 (+),score=59.80 TRINITY_DN2896_c0_g1_i2:81-974(+)